MTRSVPWTSDDYPRNVRGAHGAGQLAGETGSTNRRERPEPGSFPLITLARALAALTSGMVEAHLASALSMRLVVADIHRNESRSGRRIGSGTTLSSIGGVGKSSKSAASTIGSGDLDIQGA